MGDVADMMLDGTLCEGCGCYLGASSDSPKRCDDCRLSSFEAHMEAANASDSERAAKNRVTAALRAKAACPYCAKRVSIAGIVDHVKAKHADATPNWSE